MISYFGDFAEDDTVLIPFNTFDSNDPSASVTITNLADADIMVHKDGGTTQIVTDGATVAIDFDGITGNHLITIDTSVHADYATGSEYAVRIEGTTVDAATINAWVGAFSIERAGGALALIKAGNLGANVTQISGDTTAADNLELQYDTTGLVGDTFPATQSQLGALTVGSGGIATTANSGTTVTTGTETLTYTATVELDASYHEVAVNTTILMYYEFDVSSSGVPISVDWTGYVNTINDNVEVSFYNWAGTAFEQVGTIVGAAGTTPITAQFLATVAHVGTGANVGKVRLQFSSDGGDVATNLATDRIICTYTQAATGIANGSTVTLAAGTTNTNLVGNNWTLALGGQDISGSYIKGATVSGVSSGSGVTFEDCHLGAGTYPPGTYIRCGIGIADGLFTAASAGQYYLKDCFSVVAGSGSPDFTFAGLGSATGINNRGWFGGSVWTLDTNCTLSHEVLAGGGTTITPADAAVELRGACRSVTIALADTDVGNTIQGIIDTGPITITSAGSGDSSTINLYGHAQSLTDGSSGGTTVNNYLSGFVQTDAVKTITDQFVFTKANEVDANTQSINDAAVVGDGNATPWDGA